MKQGMLKENYKKIAIGYLIAFIVIGIWFGTFSTTQQGYFITFALFFVFGIGGYILIMKKKGIRF